MYIDEILNSVKMTGISTFTAEVGEDWTQGRTLFGGLQAMLALEAMLLLQPDAPALWSLQTTFIAPVPPGAVHGEVKILRSGRSATQMEARLMVNGESACIVVAIFGASRTSAVTIAPQQVVPPSQDIGSTAELPFIANITPNFTQHYAYHWAAGGLPFSGSTSSETRIHVRQRDAGMLSALHVVALGDAIPSPALSLLDKPAPASSLSWSFEFVRHLPPIASTEWWRIDARIIAASDGYASQDAGLYGPDGGLVAVSRQVVALFG